MSSAVSVTEEANCVSSRKMAEELSSYAQYMRVDAKDEKRLVEEATDELLTKLEELMSLVDLVRSDSSHCLTTNMPNIQSKCKELEKVFKSIDKLEAFVDMVRENVEVLDAKVVEAEKEFLPENYSLSKLFKPLFSKKDTSKSLKDVVVVVRQYEPPSIFHADKYFVGSPSESTNTVAENSEL